MKSTYLQTMGLVAAAAIFLQQNASAQITPIPYGDAASFAVLAGSTVTGGGSSDVFKGNVGVYPGTSVTGLLAAQVHDGLIYNHAETLVQNAMAAANAAFTVAAGETPFINLPQELGNQFLVPGVYRMPTLATLTGTLTLTNPDSVANPTWIFQGTDSLVTAAGAPDAPGSNIVFSGLGTPCDVLWEIPTQTTLGTYSDFVGTIISGSSVVMNTGAVLHGRAWALTAAVTLDHNTITGLPCTILGGAEAEGGGGGGGGTTPPAAVPDGGTTLLLLGFGLATLLGLGRRFLSLA